MATMTEEAVLELIESLDPFPASDTYSATKDNALAKTLCTQLLAILTSSPPHPPQTAPLAVAVAVLIGRTRALADASEQAAAMKALVTDAALGQVFVRVGELREALCYNSTVRFPP
jgi:hypothetical protein